MRFSTILVGTLAAFGLVAAQATPTQEIVQIFKELTTLSDNLRIETQKINLLSAALQGYKIAQGFGTIITKIGNASAMLSTSGSSKTRRQLAPFNDADAQTIVAALTTFVQAHQALLTVVIGKHNLLTLVPFFEPTRRALLELESAVDNFAFYLIALTPAQTSSVEEQLSSIAATIQLAISTYEQLL